MRKIFVNENYEIVALDICDREDVTEITVEDGALGNYCDAALMGYRYEPSYAVDENGEYIFDESGNKIQAGYAFYPFIDYGIIQSIQNMYKTNIAQLQDATDEMAIMLADMFAGEEAEA